MKKTIITIAIIFGLGVSYGFSQGDGGGLFGMGHKSETQTRGTREDLPLLPGYGQQESTNASPLGNGIALMLGLGGAYLLSKKRREE